MQEMLANVTKEEKEIEGTQVGKEEIKVLFFTSGTFSQLCRKSERHE